MKARQGWWDAIRHVKSVARGTNPSLNPGLSWTILDFHGLFPGLFPGDLDQLPSYPVDKWVCLKIVYPMTQWLMIIIPTKIGNIPNIFRQTQIDDKSPVRQASDASNFGSFGRRCHLGLGLGRCQLRLDLRPSLRLQRRCVAKDGCWAPWIPWPQAVEAVHVWTSSVMFSER